MSDCGGVLKENKHWIFVIVIIVFGGISMGGMSVATPETKATRDSLNQLEGKVSLLDQKVVYLDKDFRTFVRKREATDINDKRFQEKVERFMVNFEIFLEVQKAKEKIKESEKTPNKKKK